MPELPLKVKKMKKLLAIVGSYRKGKNIDTLIDRSIEGAENVDGVQVEKIYLIEKNIKYCNNCMVCRKDDPEKNIARCVIDDDMQEIYPKIDEADGFIFGTPVNMGHVTAVMKTFLERICWVTGKPGSYPLKGCPVPRSKKKKKAIIIISSGIVPPLFRMWCDDATSLIKCVCECNLGAGVIGNLYAGAVDVKGVEPYLDKAYILGKKLAV
jgi:multimeric flavodoxin WrbA